jgi:WD40 repeat protein
MRAGERRDVARDPVVIPAGRLRLIYMEDLPSQRDGVLRFIGTELKQGEQVPDHELVPVKIGDVTKQFRRLKEGDEVQADQLLAQVDDTLALADVDIKKAKLSSAKADKTVSEKTRDEAYQRYTTQVKLYGPGGTGLRATTAEDYRGALLTYQKYVEETSQKDQAIEVAKQELIQAEKTLGMYQIKPKISGTVKAINKHPGEAVKSLEPVFQIQNYDHLRVDALLAEQYANHLDKGMKVLIEPTFRDSPKQTLVGHRWSVNGVAVGKNPQKPLIVSCSDDHTVRVWEPSSEGRLQETYILNHAVPVTAVACSPPGSSANLCLLGDDQGKGWLWDLNQRDKTPIDLKGEHGSGITCVAFSRDGQMCATGGKDRQVIIWNTIDGSRRYQLSGHSNELTALYFTPNARLVSVGRDAVRFWNLGAERAEPLDQETIQRREAFDNLGVSPDGQRMMDEEGGEMRIISIPGAKTEAVLRNSTTLGKKFTNFALFSPDGRLALTTPQAGGLMQLWRIDKSRSSELRQFVSPMSESPVKSAAFAPDGSFVVAAINDRLYVWTMPTKAEIEPVWATITNVEKPIEAVQNQVKVTAEFDNPAQRLRPGDAVTLVAYPQK